MMVFKDYDTNREIPEDTRFEQMCEIDMKSMSRSWDAQSGWMPLEPDNDTPFLGIDKNNNHAIKNLIIKHHNSAGIGHFGYIIGGALDWLNKQKCPGEGQFAVSTIAGIVIRSGDNVHGSATITNCSLNGYTLTGSAIIGTHHSCSAIHLDKNYYLNGT